MAIPRSQEGRKISGHTFLSHWEKLIAFLAIINLSWIFFDISYLPLRSFWANRVIFIFNSPSITLSLRWLPDITSYYDHFKGIKAYSSGKEIESLFKDIDKQIITKGLDSRSTQKTLGIYNIKINNILDKSKTQKTERDYSRVMTMRSLIVNRSGDSDLENATKKLLSINHIKALGWENEKFFWRNKILPIIKSSYSRDINENGNFIDNTWKIDLPFQLIFLLDIFIKVNIIQTRFKGIRLHRAFLKRWLDFPLLLPYCRLLRILPTSERILRTKLIPIEPIRSAISQWVVAVLAIEIFEVLTIRAIDSIQTIVRSPTLPKKIRGLCSYESIKKKESSEISEFIRIWIPLILRRVGPNMRNQLIELCEYALQKNIQVNPFPEILKDNLVIEKAESAISFRLASSMIDTLLDLSNNAGNQIAEKDLTLRKLRSSTIDKFWEELATALESEKRLKESQLLLVSILESLKLSSLTEFKNQSGASEIIAELDDLNFNSENTPPKQSS